MRFALPNARILVHQPSGGFQGQASDIERHAEDIIKMKRRLNEIYVKHTGQTYETIERTLDRDYFLTADEAREFGLIDKVLTTRDALDGVGATALSPSRTGLPAFAWIWVRRPNTLGGAPLSFGERLTLCTRAGRSRVGVRFRS